MMALDEAIEAAVAQYLVARTPAAREHLCEAALPLVRRMAMSVLRRLPAHFGVDDLIGDGCIGLVRAIDRFDPERGMRFEVWAARLIRGAMLNGLRAMDIIPERVRRDARSLDAARWRLAQHQGSSPSDAAAAARAGLTRRKLDAVLLALRRAIPVSLDAPITAQSDQPPVIALGDRIASHAVDPAHEVVQRAARAAVATAVKSLSEREQLILTSFYDGGATFRVIGGRLGISKQRVSQIHGRALASLRTLLATARAEA